MPVVQAEGLEAVFKCQYTGASYDWFINGTIHSRNTGDIVANILSLPSEDSPASLRITAKPEYNNITVQCRAEIPMEQDVFMRSNVATLMVYG